MKLATLVSAMLAAALVASSALAQDADFEDPIGLTGHGSLFDRQGRPIEATPEFLAETLEGYLDALTARATAETMREFEQFRERIANATPAKAAPAARRLELMGMAAEVAWLSARQPPEDRIDTHINIIRYLLETGAVEGMDTGEVPPELREIFEETRATPGGGGIVALSTLAEGQAYINECAANGVPIPPDWGSAQWVSTGSLSDAEEFISQADPRRAYSSSQSTSPPGSCIALPRVAGNGTGDIVLLGIICQGEQTGKVCFWDNQENDQGFPIGVNESVPLSDFAGGAELFEWFGRHLHRLPRRGEPVHHPSRNGARPARTRRLRFLRGLLVRPARPSGLAAERRTFGCCRRDPRHRAVHRLPSAGWHRRTLPAAFAEHLRLLRHDPPVGGRGHRLAGDHASGLARQRRQRVTRPGDAEPLPEPHRSPLLRIESAVLDYGEVELGFSFAKALVIHNDGNANLTVSVELTTPAGDPDLAQWSEIT